MEATAESLPYVEISNTLADTATAKIQDSSFGYEYVLKRFNDCIFELAGEFLLPECDTWDDLQADANVGYVRLPPRYMKNLRHCHSTSHNRAIKIYGSRSQLYRLYSNLDQTGVVRGVAVKGRYLYYQRIPSSAETLRVNYYRYPERLSSREDKPDEIPGHLHERLLVNFACWKAYEEIEDGIEGQKVNANYYKSEYMQAKAALAVFLGPEERNPIDIEEELCWNDWAYGYGYNGF